MFLATNDDRIYKCVDHRNDIIQAPFYLYDTSVENMENMLMLNGLSEIRDLGYGLLILENWTFNSLMGNHQFLSAHKKRLTNFINKHLNKPLEDRLAYNHLEYIELWMNLIFWFCSCNIDGTWYCYVEFIRG